MAKYSNFRYIYPPRPKNAISFEDLNFWDNGSLIAQPKLNGSNCLIFTNGERHIIMNRHNQRLTNFQLSSDEIKSIYHGDGEWMIINGEYMNKSKSDENNQVFNHKFVIFDILTLGGDYLVGKTFKERIDILDDLYGKVDSEKEYLYKITDNIYRVKSYESNFLDLFNKLTPIDMIEGLVMKRASARLEIGSNELNNVKSQLKCRKSTKNYKY
jgi:ATP-dependent DNA ligase